MTSARKNAFTLFELLVTMSIITIIAAGGYLTLARSTSDRSLERAADTLHSLVRIARTQAITNGVHSRLIINNDPSDKESYLRRIGVMIEDTTTSGYWTAVDRGTYLPEGVYVVPQAGEVSFPADWPATGRRSVYQVTNQTGDGPALYNFDYPLKEKVAETEDGKPEWLCIQFAPNGRLSSAKWGGGDSIPEANRLIIAKGSWGSDKISLMSSNDFIGVAFKKSGGSYQTEELILLDD